MPLTRLATLGRRSPPDWMGGGLRISIRKIV